MKLRSLLLAAVVGYGTLWSCASRADVVDPIYAAVAVQTVDYFQTLGISESCHSDHKFHETNPILGNCPSKADVSKYFAASTLGLVGLHYILPEKWKPVLSYVWLGVEVGATAHNASIGVKLSF